MFGADHTYFADSPVVIDIRGLAWPESSPFTVVSVEVLRTDNTLAGKFRADANGQSSISFDISAALRAMLNERDFRDEVYDAENAAAGQLNNELWLRSYTAYSLRISTEYISDGSFTTTICQDDQGRTIIPGGRCLIGGLTEMERHSIRKKADADASYWDNSNPNNGDASTKPTTSLERVGRNSITSWVDVDNVGTQSIFFPANASASTPHLPLVIRDTIPYFDFLFVNRRGAVETCSARMLESMDIEIDTQYLALVDRPSFFPSRSITARTTGGRRTWSMSSGHQTREWLEWWALEFLMARKHWMYYRGKFIPVIVEPSKKQIEIHNRAKQEMKSIDFNVLLSLEG